MQLVVLYELHFFVPYFLPKLFMLKVLGSASQLLLRAAGLHLRAEVSKGWVSLLPFIGLHLHHAGEPQASKMNVLML